MNKTQPNLKEIIQKPHRSHTETNLLRFERWISVHSKHRLQRCSTLEWLVCLLHSTMIRYPHRCEETVYCDCYCCYWNLCGCWWRWWWRTEHRTQQHKFENQKQDNTDLILMRGVEIMTHSTRISNPTTVSGPDLHTKDSMRTTWVVCFMLSDDEVRREATENDIIKRRNEDEWESEWYLHPTRS